MAKTGFASLLCLVLFACRAEPPSLVLCCAGDSIMRPMPPYFRQLLHSPERRLVLHEWAQGGLSTSTYLGFYGEIAASRRRVRPHAILLQIGTNDVRPILEGRCTVADFESNLSTILGEFGKYRSPAGNRSALLVATVPLFSAAAADAAGNSLVVSRLNPAVRKAARAAGAEVVDNFEILKNEPGLYDPDGVHPNPLGEAALARSWARSLRALLGRGRRARL